MKPATTITLLGAIPVVTILSVIYTAGQYQERVNAQAKLCDEARVEIRALAEGVVALQIQLAKVEARLP